MGPIADDRPTLMAYHPGAEGNVAEPAAAPGLLVRHADGNDYYTVVSGDSGCFGVAKKIYGDGNKWHIIAKANPGILDPGKLKPGQTLVIPRLAGETTTRPFVGGGTTRPAGELYKIKANDNLESIARTKYGDGTLWREIVKANPGLDPNHMKIGQEIVLPVIDPRRTTMPASGPASRPAGGRRPSPSPSSSPSPSPSPVRSPAPTRGLFD